MSRSTARSRSREPFNSRSETVHLRSLALLLVIFGVSAALAGYVGKKYEPVAQQEAQPAALMAPASQPVVVAPAPARSKPEAAAVAPMPPAETSQPLTLQSAPPISTPPDVSTPAAPPARSAAETIAPNTAEAPRTTGSRDAQAPKCNQQACADAYRSFDAADCTYLPANGPRRLCKK
jgi:BA14K-like protein